MGDSGDSNENNHSLSTKQGAQSSLREMKDFVGRMQAKYGMRNQHCLQNEVFRNRTQVPVKDAMSREPLTTTNRPCPCCHSPCTLRCSSLEKDVSHLRVLVSELQRDAARTRQEVQEYVDTTSMLIASLQKEVLKHRQPI